MRNIFKYKLEGKVRQVVKAPFVEVLDIQIQNGTPCLWAIVDDQREGIFNDSIIVYSFGTGADDVNDYKNSDLKYLSTTQIGNYVLHWFYE